MNGKDVRQDGRQRRIDREDDVRGKTSWWQNVLVPYCVVNGSDDVGSHVDHHASIGHGRIGPDCFRRIMNDSRFENLPLILETPVDCHSANIDLLYSFVD